MAIKIKSHWWNDANARSTTEIAGALAFIIWRVAVDKAITLHCERFIYRDDHQRLAVIQEYLIFLIQLTDRLAHALGDEPQRHALIPALVNAIMHHLQDNSQDLFGAGDYAPAFFALLNERSDEYAAFHWTEDGPSYPFLRHLGFTIQTLMGSDADNRWVIDQVMDRDGFDAYQQLAHAWHNLLN